MLGPTLAVRGPRSGRETASVDARGGILSPGRRFVFYILQTRVPGTV